MKTSKATRRVFATFIALSLVYGVWQLQYLRQTTDGRAGIAGVAGDAGRPTDTPAAGLPEVVLTEGKPDEQSARSDMPAPNASWSVMFETASDGPPRDLGEPLDADDDAPGANGFDADPVDIGPPLDADDPLTQEVYPTFRSPMEVGELLDADFEPPPIAAADPIQVGSDRDADDHAPRSIDYTDQHAIEIGEILDAGAPGNR